MSKVITKPSLSLDSLLQHELFQEARAGRVDSQEEKLRECRDLYLKAHFGGFLVKVYQYGLLEDGAQRYTADIWGWVLAAVNGLRSANEIPSNVLRQLRTELSRSSGGVYDVVSSLSVLERARLLLSYFRSAVRFGSLDTAENVDYLRRVEENLCRELGRLVLDVHSEQELGYLVKLVELYLLDLQVRCLHRELDKSLYWALCRKFPLMSRKLSGTPQSRNGVSCEEHILLQLQPKKKIARNKHASSERRAARPPATAPPRPGARQQDRVARPGLPVMAPGSPMLTADRSENCDRKPQKSYAAILNYLPKWLTDFTDSRFIALVVMLAIALRKLRWFKLLSSHGLVHVRTIFNAARGL
ncbi:AaceriACR280Cp [[Ashbya] aceris (nom. inval.)]|nr:AaceriACR280Cp [[Ashbya] aceris (nom. inval.)]